MLWEVYFGRKEMKVMQFLITSLSVNSWSPLTCQIVALCASPIDGLHLSTSLDQGRRKEAVLVVTSARTLFSGFSAWVPLPGCLQPQSPWRLIPQRGLWRQEHCPPSPGAKLGVPRREPADAAASFCPDRLGCVDESLFAVM